MTKQYLLTCSVLVIIFACTGCTQIAEPSSKPSPEAIYSPTIVVPNLPKVPVPTLMATRGEIMADDDCSEDRRRGLGFWSLSPNEPNVCRVTHDIDRVPLHIPIASYHLEDHENVIVEVTFRWGEPMGAQYNDQLLGILSDLRPNEIKGHKLESWISGSGRFTKAGLALTSTIAPKVLLDEQPFDNFMANTWYTAVLEIVGNEALLRFQDRVVYVDMPRIAGPKNKITLVFGTTWHEVKHVRIWHATANPKWEKVKDKVLASREAFTKGSFSY